MTAGPPKAALPVRPRSKRGAVQHPSAVLVIPTLLPASFDADRSMRPVLLHFFFGRAGTL
jgi:hypothetical protein